MNAGPDALSWPTPTKQVAVTPLQFIDKDGGNVGKFGIMPTVGVEICFLLHAGLERVTVCHCLGELWEEGFSFE